MIGGHRLGRQDLHQGPDHGADRPAPAVASNPTNFNTEIGLPLAILGAPLGTEVMVLEMGMRGFGQIAELTAIAEPDVGVITNIGPGAPGADRLAGGRRAGQGRAAGGLLRRRDRGRALRRAAARAVAARGAEGRHASARAATSPSRAARCAAARSRTRRPRTTSCSPTASGSSSSSRSTRPHADEHAGGGRRRAGGRGRAGRAAWTCASPALRGEHVAPRRAPPSSTTATTPTRSRCVPPSTTSRPRDRRPPPRGARRHARARPRRGRAAPRRRRLRRTPGVDVLVTVGPLAADHARRLRRRG